MHIEQKLRERIRLQGKSKSTADAYWHWVKRFFDFCKASRIGKETKAETAVERFLTHLANRENVSATTQNQAFAALCYLYRELKKRPLQDVSALRAKRPNRTRTVASVENIVAIRSQLQGEKLLAVDLMYGCGLRIGELALLRWKDINFERCQIHVHDAKGQKDRLVQFPAVLHAAMRSQMQSMQSLWNEDQRERRNGVSLPHAWHRKSPSSRLAFAWYYVFCSANVSRCPDTNLLLRHHKDVGNFAKALKAAVDRSGIAKRITAHCLRHSFATHTLENGGKIHHLQELMGHTDIRTTESYIHVQKDGATATPSPLAAVLMHPTLQRPENSTRPTSRPRFRTVG